MQRALTQVTSEVMGERAQPTYDGVFASEGFTTETFRDSIAADLLLTTPEPEEVVTCDPLRVHGDV